MTSSGKKREGEESTRIKERKMDSEKIQLFVFLKWRRFHAILSSVGQSYYPRWRNQTLFFPLLVSQTSLWPLISRRVLNPRQELHTVNKFIRLSRKPPCPRFLEEQIRARWTRFLGNRRDTKSNYVDLRFVHKDGKHPLSPWIYSFAVRNFVDRGWSREIGILGISRDFWGKCLVLRQGSFDTNVRKRYNFTH